MSKTKAPGKKLLLIFDLSQTLFFAYKSKLNSFSRVDTLRKKPNDTINDYKIYYRSGRNEFLDTLFRKQMDYYDIGVWSSLDREKTAAFSQSFFDRYYRKLLFVAATNRADYEGTKSSYSENPLAIKKNLSQIYQKFPSYEHHNTIVISNYKNLIDSFVPNDIIVPKYSPDELGDKFDTDYVLQSLLKYLLGIKAIMDAKGFEDVRSIIAAKSFIELHQRVVHNNSSYNEYF